MSFSLRMSPSPFCLFLFPFYLLPSSFSLLPLSPIPLTFLNIILSFFFALQISFVPLFQCHPARTPAAANFRVSRLPSSLLPSSPPTLLPPSSLSLLFSFLLFILFFSYANNETSSTYHYSLEWAPHHLGTWPVANILTCM